MRPKRWRKPKDPAEDQAGLEQAERALETARAQRREQERKREAERQRVIAKMERLAEANHLASLVWDVVTGNGGQ